MIYLVLAILGVVLVVAGVLVLLNVIAIGVTWWLLMVVGIVLLAVAGYFRYSNPRNPRPLV